MYVDPDWVASSEAMVDLESRWSYKIYLDSAGQRLIYSIYHGVNRALNHLIN